MTAPEFPIRIIFDDGEVSILDSPDDLLETIDSLDSAESTRVWVRDALDRTVRLRMRAGQVEVFELA